MHLPFQELPFDYHADLVKRQPSSIALEGAVDYRGLYHTFVFCLFGAFSRGGFGGYLWHHYHAFCACIIMLYDRAVENSYLHADSRKGEDRASESCSYCRRGPLPATVWAKFPLTFSGESSTSTVKQGYRQPLDYQATIRQDPQSLIARAPNNKGFTKNRQTLERAFGKRPIGPKGSLSCQRSPRPMGQLPIIGCYPKLSGSNLPAH